MHPSMVGLLTQSIASTDTTSILHQVSWLWERGNSHCLHCIVLIFLDLPAILAQVVDNRLHQQQNLQLLVHAFRLRGLALDKRTDVVGVCYPGRRNHVNFNRATFILVAPRSGRVLHRALVASIFGYARIL